ncbi:MAG: hypothetical protein ACK5GN_08455 [Pseudomonadota bacterium]
MGRVCLLIINLKKVVDVLKMAHPPKITPAFDFFMAAVQARSSADTEGLRRASRSQSIRAKAAHQKIKIPSGPFPPAFYSSASIDLSRIKAGLGLMLAAYVFWVSSTTHTASAQGFPYRGLLRDIADRPNQAASSHPKNFVSTDSGVFFLASKGELWYTDGSRDRTRRIPMVTPEGYTDITPANLVAYGSTVAFSSGFYDPSGAVGCSESRGEGCSSSGLFVVNPARTGVSLVREKLRITNATTSDRNGQRILGAGNRLFFFGEESHRSSNGSSANQLWLSNGTRQGTQLIFGFDGNPVGLFERIVHNSNLYFFTTSSSSSLYGLWRSDGTTQGTQIISGNQCVGLTSYAGRLFFVEYKLNKAHISKLAADGKTVELSVVLPEAPLARSDSPVFVGAGGHLYFLSAGTTSLNKDIWRTDPLTLATTKVASDVRDPQNLTEFNAALYFVATRSDVGRELFKADGSGVVLAHDIRTGVSDSLPSDLTAIGQELYFAADDGNSGREVWRVFGANGSQRALAEDIWPGLNSSLPYYFIGAARFMVFSADDGITGIEPWIFSVDALGQLPTPTPTVTPSPTPTTTPRPTATPTRTPTSRGSGSISGDTPIVIQYAARGVSGQRTMLAYKVRFDGLTRESVLVYRSGAANAVFRTQTGFSNANVTNGKSGAVYIPAKRLQPGRYRWCILSTAQRGQTSVNRCAALTIR